MCEGVGFLNGGGGDQTFEELVGMGGQCGLVDGGGYENGVGGGDE